MLEQIQRQQTIDATVFMQCKINIQPEKGADRFVTRQLWKYSQLIANARYIVAIIAVQPLLLLSLVVVVAAVTVTHCIQTYDAFRYPRIT